MGVIKPLSILDFDNHFNLGIANLSNFSFKHSIMFSISSVLYCFLREFQFFDDDDNKQKILLKLVLCTFQATSLKRLHKNETLSANKTLLPSASASDFYSCQLCVFS